MTTHIQKISKILFILIISLSFSTTSFASCLKLSDNDIDFLPQAGSCTDKANDGVVTLYNNSNIGNIGDKRNNLNSLIAGRNNGGYSIHFTFDRDNSAALSGDQIFFSAYENLYGGTPIARAGIRSGIFFYELNGQTINGIDMSVLDDNNIVNPHIAVILPLS